MLRVSPTDIISLRDVRVKFVFYNMLRVSPADIISLRDG